MSDASDKKNAEKKAEPKVLAFAYDSSTTGSEAPVSFGVIPGIWTPDEPVLPGAFGMSVEQMRDLIREYNLPLREVHVKAGKAVEETDKGWNHIPTEDSRLVAPAKPTDAVIETKDGPITAPTPAGVHRPLLPLAAAHQARNTVLAEGGSLEAAADAARDAGGGYGDAIADRTDAAAEDWQRALDNAADEAAMVESGELIEDLEGGQ